MSLWRGEVSEIDAISCRSRVGRKRSGVRYSESSARYSKIGCRVVGRSALERDTGVPIKVFTKVDLPAPVEPPTTTVRGASKAVSRGRMYSSYCLLRERTCSLARVTSAISRGRVSSSRSLRAEYTRSSFVCCTCAIVSHFIACLLKKLRVFPVSLSCLPHEF